MELNTDQRKIFDAIINIGFLHTIKQRKKRGDACSLFEEGFKRYKEQKRKQYER